MKLTKMTSAALALAFAAAISTSAHAQLATYNEGDLLIGFENGGANNYIVDLGAASKFIDATAPLSFSLSTSDLTSAFTVNWATTAGVQWGVVGGSDATSPLTLGSDTLAKNTLFFTKGESTVGTQSAVPHVFNNATSNALNGAVQTFAVNGFGAQSTSAGSTTALQAVIDPSTDSAGYSANNPHSNAFGSGFNIEQPATGSAIGATDSALDLYEFTPNSTTTTPAAYLGDFTLNSSGVLTFDSAAPPTEAVPEPSSYALAGLAAATFLVLRRRKAISVQ
jgi:PEP-CTERM motif